MHFDASFWVFVGFVTLFAFIGRKTWVGITSALDARAKKIEADIEEAAKRRQEALTLLKTCQRRQIEATERAHEILKHAEEEAKRLKQKVFDDLQEHTEAEERLLQERIHQAEERAFAEIRERALLLAAEATRDLILKNPDPAFEEKLFEQTRQILSDIKSPLVAANVARRTS
ncbi:MAG: F0F1 ATP synthase subunit B [Proteobacteria bacterium]|nr:F0F1 ATP synthase subunit B [Pseudomonadota bacterium]